MVHLMSSPIKQKRVLIVDDERVIADTLAIIFSNKGYEARAVYSAEQAFELISDWLPGLAIIDVQLSRMNGIDLAIRLRAEYPAALFGTSLNRRSAGTGTQKWSLV
jgi:DNA-binding response OmpR family regulator